MTPASNTTSSDGHAVTRRSFVAAGAGFAASSMVAPAFVHAGAKDEIRVGLVGCGGRGTGAAWQALRADPGVVLYAMGDAFDDHLQNSHTNLLKHPSADRVQVAPERRFVGFDAFQKVIDNVDVVLLATPPAFRPAHLEAAIKANCHVFCEKPMAVDAPGLRLVLATAELAKKKQRSLVSGFCWRYSTPQREIYRRVLDGQIGDIRAIQTTYQTSPLSDVARTGSMSDMEWQLRNWKAFTWLSGDHICEQAIHGIDWINWAMNGEMPVRAFANGGRQCRDGEWTGNMFDHFSVVYEFASGVRAYHHCRQIANCSNDNTAFIMGTKGTCYSNPWAPQGVIEGENPWRWEGDSNDMYQQEHDELFASIRSGKPMNDGVWMCNSTMLGMMGRMCAYTGKTLTWDECWNSQEQLTPSTWNWGDMPTPEIPHPGRTPFT